MRFHVLIEILLHVEVLPAPLAHELLVSDVDAHVRAQLVLVLEPLVAILKWRGRGETRAGTRPGAGARRKEGVSALAHNCSLRIHGR